METATEVLVSRGPWPEQGRNDAIEVLFDDGSQSPFALLCGMEQVDRLPLDADAGRQLVCTVWTEGPRLRLTLPAYYRRVPRLPDLSPRS